MPNRLSLRGFLTTARTALTAPASQRTRPLTFVIGNESADLDSLCSAVVLAYIRSNTPPHRLHIPLSNIPRADLDLRVELTAVLRHAGLRPSDLLTLSDLPDSSELPPSDTEWLLVDHNAPTGSLRPYAECVVGCVDHHVDEGFVDAQAGTRVLEPCGSCMSLVVEDGRQAWEAMSGMNMEDGAGEVAGEDDRLARLAMGPILIDTVNMTATKKIKDKDLSAMEFLDGKIHDSGLDRDKYYEELSALKEDISSLSIQGIFRKDYKEWEVSGLKLGISSVVQNLAYLLSKADGSDPFLDGFSQWANERGLDIAGIMTASHPDGVFQRELLLWALNAKGDAIVKKFLDTAEELKLETYEGGKLDDKKKMRRAWRSWALEASRKRVAPMLREAMKEGA